MRFRSFVKANSVEFLDLCAPEFHETRKTTLIYALDLSVAPQRYYYIPEWFDETRDETIPHLTDRLENGRYPPFDNLDNKPVISSRKLIQVARFNKCIDYGSLSVSFSKFVINGYESFPRNWESERIRIYLKYVKAYCRYVDESIIVPHPYSGKIILTFERPPIVYDTNANSWFKSAIKCRVAEKLILTLFENNSTDSNFAVEIFRSKWASEIQLLFSHDAKVTEYLLNHLKTEMYDIRHVFETLEKYSWRCSLLRSNPEHLVVLLNYGFKIESQPNIWNIMFCQFQPSYQEETYEEFPYILREDWSDLKPREEAILDIFAHFLTFSGPHFAVYLKSVRYIWRSIPDAFITYEEMMTLLLRNADIADVEDICSELQKWEFDSFDTILQPRSLRHYSRCALRDVLNQNSQLPEGIELLALPSRLKSYLRLEY